MVGSCRFRPQTEVSSRDAKRLARRAEILKSLQDNSSPFAAICRTSLCRILDLAVD